MIIKIPFSKYSLSLTCDHEWKKKIRRNNENR